MRDPKRIDIVLKEVRRVWQIHPDWRLCQVLNNTAIQDGWESDDLFYLEDEKLLAALKKL